MDVSLLVRLIDQVSAPARKVGDALAGIGKGAKDMAREAAGGFAGAVRKGFSVENVEQATRNAEQALTRARGRLMGAIGMALTLAAPLRGLTAFEDRLVDFGNVAGIFGDDLKQIETDLRTLGPAVNKTAGEMLTALEYLVGKGLSPEEGMKALRAVGMTATATKAEVEDMAASGFAVLDNLRVPAEQLQMAFDAMAQAGKSGGFELKGMAQYFPGLTAAARSLGMEGVDAVAELAAALQVAMKGAGDESTAANNMMNFLSKLSSPETVKRFADLGVDLKKEFRIAEENGVSVFEHMLQRIHDITDGDQFKMGELFGDQQVLAFLRPLMANIDEFREIRNAAMNSAGVNEQDFQRVMATGAASAKALVVELDNLLANGSPLLDLFKQLTGQLVVALKAMNEFAAANPELTAYLVQGAAALMTFVIAGRLLSFVVASIRLPLLALSKTFLLFKGARNIATGWRLMSGAGRMLAGSAGAMLTALARVVPSVRAAIAGFSMLSTVSGTGGLATAFAIVKGAIASVVAAAGTLGAPVWAAVGALLAAGFALWKYWDRVSSFVSGFASVFGDMLGGAVDGAIGLLDGLLTKIGELLGFSAADLETFKATAVQAIASAFDFSGVIETARVVLADFWSWLGSFFSAEKLSGAEKAQMYEAGRALAQSMVDGLLQALTSGWAALEAWLSGKVDWLKTQWSNIDLTGVAAAAFESLLAGFTGAWAQIESWVSGKVEWLKNAFNFAWPDFLGGSGNDRPQPSVTDAARRANEGGGAASNMLAGMDNAAAAAADDLSRGGRDGGSAVAQGGREAADAMSRAAAEIRNAGASISAAIRSAASRQGSALPGAIATSRTGALHGGTE